MELWVGCVAGGLTHAEYRQKLETAGFESVDIEATRVYSLDDAKEFLTAAGIDIEAIASEVEGKFISAFVRARKPARCCETNCWTASLKPPRNSPTLANDW